MQQNPIKNWSVKRSGPSLTVTGKDEAGADIKLTSVAEVTKMTLSEEREVVVAIMHQGEASILD